MASSVEKPAEDANEQRLRRARSMRKGFIIGLAAGFLVMAVKFAISGWRIFPHAVITYLFFGPYIGTLVGYVRCPIRRGSWSWQELRFSTRTLLALIAYFSLLLGMGTATGRIGRTASQYHQKYASSASMAKLFGDWALKSKLDSTLRRDNVTQLRARKVPEGLLQLQKDFLRSLDRTATKQYREYRYQLIEDGEERLRRLAARNAVVFRGLTDYHEKLAEKYDRAQWRPWLPVGPDPPTPPRR